MRLPAAFLAAGIVVKGVLVLAWRWFHFPWVLNLLTTYDPGAFWFAEMVTPLFFDQRRIAPVPGEAAAFEALLIAGFAIECLLIGMVVTWLWPRRARRGSPVTVR